MYVLIFKGIRMSLYSKCIFLSLGLLTQTTFCAEQVSRTIDSYTEVKAAQKKVTNLQSCINAIVAHSFPGYTPAYYEVQKELTDAQQALDVARKNRIQQNQWQPASK